MLLIEKVLILRLSEIFQNIPETDLVQLASILEEVYLSANETLFAKGDPGNCMYLIFSGSISIHDGTHSLAVLNENEIVGELSLLDAESRSASATALEECLLLKLEQEDFYEIMMSNEDILKGILKTLCKRIRASNKKSITIANTSNLS